MNPAAISIANFDTSPPESKTPISLAIKGSLEKYFSDLNGHPADNIWRMVMQEVEKPILEIILREVRGNQSRAAQMLGISRSTLRKKIKQYELE
ncbi:MAG: DNA-binding transcriptional regulator Fis [Gammaproteobacteria bacterium]|nr:MAG: DNA-binding transcriptional regulator Fis [Gammaproteobacteria bacterium]